MENNATQTELQPCPFCSSEPEWINETLSDSHFYIKCPHCHIVMKEDRRDKVIGMWNTRNAYALLKEENQKLSKDNDALRLSAQFQSDDDVEAKLRNQVYQLKEENEEQWIKIWNALHIINEQLPKIKKLTADNAELLEQVRQWIKNNEPIEYSMVHESINFEKLRLILSKHSLT